jgi:hypothetical protein
MSLKSPPSRRFSQNTRPFPNRTSLIESNGPQGKIRGTPQQLLERYLALARDAVREGDSVLSEGLFQHAEHYRRILSECPPPKARSFEEGLREEFSSGDKPKEASSEDVSEVVFQLDDAF